MHTSEERPPPEEIRHRARDLRAQSDQLRGQLYRLLQKSEQLSNHMATRLDELLEHTIRQEVYPCVTSDEDVSTGVRRRHMRTEESTIIS
jgi:hypothetical protein